MTTAVTTWIYRGTNLSQVAYDVRALGADEQIPVRRGDNLLVPGKSGRIHTIYKRLEERRLALAMVVDAMPTAGGTRGGSQLWTNLETLKTLFAQDGRGTLQYVNAAGGTRTAQAEVVGAIEFTAGGPYHYNYVVELAFADPFWYSPTVTTTAGTLSASPGTIALTNSGSYRAEAPTFTIVTSGTPCVNPKLAIGADYVQYAGTVGTGGTLTITCGSFSALLGTADVSGSITHDGELIWLPVPTGTNNLVLTADTMSTAVVTTTFTQAFL